MSFHRLKFDKPEFQKDFFDKKKTDCRLRAFVREAIDNFPDHEWLMTSARRYPKHIGSGHNHGILSAFDFRSKSWSPKQLSDFYNWCYRWWLSKPDMIDVIIEDGRFDKRYKDYSTPCIHVEIDKPYWK
jgi:hypothetical protein